MNLAHQTILVTGGAGFIGSELCRQLKTAGAKLRIVDNLANGKQENLAEILDEQCQLHVTDIRDYTAMESLLQGVDYVFHLACLEHNLSIWHRVGSLAERTCSQIVNQIPASTTKVVIRNLPGSIDGVYFLRNGLKGCLDLKSMQILNLQVDDTGASDRSKTTAVFEWNPMTDSLLKESE